MNKLSEAINEILSKHPIHVEREKKGLLPGNIVLLRGCGSRLSKQSKTFVINCNL